jgi:hypothetical protein
MTDPLKSSAVRNPRVISRQVDDEAVLVHPEKGKVQVLNPVAARIWGLIDARLSGAEIAAIISSEYEVDLDQACADTRAFLIEIQGKDLISFS